MIMAIKQTPIYEIAKKSNAKFVEQDGWQVAQNFGKAASTESVALCDQSHRGKIRIEGQTAGAMLDADELAIGVGKAVDDGRVYRLRRDLFFVTTVAGAVADVAGSLTTQAANSPDLITVTDVTHGNAELWLIGPNSAELLSRLCGLDFHNSQLQDGTAKQSSIAKTTQLIIRRDLGEQPAYALIGGRSLAAYLWQTILEAGQDLGIQPIGSTVLESLF
jgi:heterotetrameric sarcosine oxidase gamma subunit